MEKLWPIEKVQIQENPAENENVEENGLGEVTSLLKLFEINVAGLEDRDEKRAKRGWESDQTDHGYQSLNDK